MQTQQIINQIDSLLQEVDRARHAAEHDDLSGGLPDDELAMIETRLMAAVERLAPVNSSYLRTARSLKGWAGYKILQLGGILKALREDFQAGYLKNIEEIVHGAVFDDFLDMATELIGKGYKDPAAVIAGSVLEEHIRKLSFRNQINTVDPKGRAKNFDALSVELVKAGQFAEPQRKILVGWYGQRNAAAHGDYTNVIEAEVRRMIEGIRDFIVRMPA